MKTAHSTKVILLGILLGILFSFITYQNFEHNIEEVIEEQEKRSNYLVDHNINMILQNINGMVGNTLLLSIDKKLENAILSKDVAIIETYISKIKKNLERHYDISSIEFISKENELFVSSLKLNKSTHLTACFIVKNNKSFYSVSYPFIQNNTQLGYFTVNLKNNSVLNSIKENIDAEIALFISRNLIKSDESQSELFFEDFNVLETTNDGLVAKMLKVDGFELEDNEEIFSIDDKLIELDSVELSSDEKILIIFKDVTDTYKSIKETREGFLLYFIIVLAIFLLITYYIYFTSKKTILQQYDELLIKKEESEKLLTVKSEFLANMSHEIRTPLNAINGFIELIKEENKDNKIVKYINTIQDSSKSLLNIIEDILDLSKIESAKMTINKIDFETRAEFETIIYLFDTKLSDKNIDFALNIDENVPQYLHSDSLRIKQVISNLLDNAIKFTNENKKISIDITYFNNNLNVSIEDEGIGIPKERQEKVFKAFTQADNSTTREYGGTGLGLTISYKLIHLLDGTINLISEVNKGSKFSFSIPAEIGKKVVSSDNLGTSLDIEDKKLLLVEDNKSNQLFMKVMFKKLNINYDIASDGLEAVELFKKNKYDIILMDENMPNMCGVEATQNIIEIEREKKLSHTPIVALTANALEGDREKFLSAGMDEYLAKPLSKKQLIKVLTDFLVKEDNSIN